MLKSKLQLFLLKFGALLGLPLLIALVFLYTQEFERLLATPKEAWEQDLTADCGVVLTGGPGRVKEGLDLLLRKQIQRLIIAGVNPQVSLQDLYPQLALYPQVREGAIVLERYSETTFGNAQQSLPIVEALQCRQILLITSYLHMNRAYRTFLAAYPDDIRVIPYAIAGSDVPPKFWDLFMESTKAWFYAFWAY